MKIGNFEIPQIKLPLWLLFVLSFVLGLVVFLPIERLGARLTSTLRNQTGFDVQIHGLHLGTGLGLGFSKGGLFALRATELKIPLGDQGEVACRPGIITISLVHLLVGQAKLGISCGLDKNGEIVASASKGFFSKDGLDLDVDLESINLHELAKLANLGALSGILNGNVHIDKLDLRGSGWNLLSWKINGTDVATPPSTSPIFSLPSLKLGQVQSSGKLDRRKLVVDQFKFGNAQTPMEGQLTANMGLDSSQGPFWPINGELLGNLRTDPDFEKRQLTGKINLDLAFGVAKASGRREFKKVVNGSPLSIVMDPPVQ